MHSQDEHDVAEALFSLSTMAALVAEQEEQEAAAAEAVPKEKKKRPRSQGKPGPKQSEGAHGPGSVNGSNKGSGMGPDAKRVAREGASEKERKPSKAAVKEADRNGPTKAPLKQGGSKGAGAAPAKSRPENLVGNRENHEKVPAPRLSKHVAEELEEQVLPAEGRPGLPEGQPPAAWAGMPLAGVPGLFPGAGVGPPGAPPAGWGPAAGMPPTAGAFGVLSRQLGDAPAGLHRPWKRCASHVYIAHFIESHSQALKAGIPPPGLPGGLKQTRLHPSEGKHLDASFLQAKESLDKRGLDAKGAPGVNGLGKDAAQVLAQASGGLAPGMALPGTRLMDVEQMQQQYAQLAQQLAFQQQMQPPGGMPFWAASARGFPGMPPFGGPPPGAGHPPGSSPFFGLGLQHLPPGLAVSGGLPPGFLQGLEAKGELMHMHDANHLRALLADAERSRHLPGPFGDMNLTPEQAKALFGGAPMLAEQRLRVSGKANDA